MPGTDGVEATRRIMAESPCPILVVTATVSGHIGKVYQAMGYGALDAVDTPVLGPEGDSQADLRCCDKIDLIGRLIGKAPSRTPDELTPSAALPTGRSREPALHPLVVIGASTGGPFALAGGPGQAAQGASRRHCDRPARRCHVRAGAEGMARRAVGAKGHAHHGGDGALRGRDLPLVHRRITSSWARIAGFITRQSRARSATVPRSTFSSTAWPGTGPGRASACS